MNLKKEEVIDLIMDSYRDYISIEDNFVNELNDLIGSSMFKYDEELDQLVIKNYKLNLVPHSRIEYVKVLGQEDWAGTQTVYIPTCLIRFFGLDKTFNKYTGLSSAAIVAHSSEAFTANGGAWSIHSVPEEV